MASLSAIETNCSAFARRRAVRRNRHPRGSIPFQLTWCLASSASRSGTGWASIALRCTRASAAAWRGRGRGRCRCAKVDACAATGTTSTATIARRKTRWRGDRRPNRQAGAIWIATSTDTTILCKPPNQISVSNPFSVARDFRAQLIGWRRRANACRNTIIAQRPADLVGFEHAKDARRLARL